MPLMDPHSQYGAVREQIAQAIGEVIDSGRFILGPRVREVETTFAADVGAAHGIGVANGTDALVIALRALGVQPGDEVICPSFTFYATAESIAGRGRDAGLRRHRGRAPTASTRPRSTPPSRRARARSCRCTCSATRPRWAPLGALCERHGLALLEDAAQAYGAALDGVRCGALGDAATFSFFPTKNLPCFGDGGLITTQQRRGRGPVPRAALPRLRGQAHVRRSRLQLAARRDPGRRPAAAAARWSTAGTTTASRSPRATRSSASASCVIAALGGARCARTSTTSMSCRSQDARAPRRGPGRARHRERHATTATPLHLQPVFAHLGGPRVAARDRAPPPREPRPADVRHARRGRAGAGGGRGRGPATGTA